MTGVNKSCHGNTSQKLFIKWINIYGSARGRIFLTHPTLGPIETEFSQRPALVSSPNQTPLQKSPEIGQETGSRIILKLQADDNFLFLNPSLLFCYI